MTRNNGRFCERDKKEEQLFSLCELEVIRWWQRRTTIFLSARLIEVARLASTLVEVNICKICKIQKTTNFTHFISKIFHISPSKNVHIYTFIIVTVWANFTLGSNSVKGKARPNILYEEIWTSEEDQPMTGRNYPPRRGAAC